MSRRLLFLITGLIFVFLLGGVVLYFSWGRSKFMRPSITISQQTTFFTAPLKTTGRVYYAKALNQLYGSNVAPDENAAIVLWQIDHDTWNDYESRVKAYESELGNVRLANAQSRLLVRLFEDGGVLPEHPEGYEQREAARSAAMRAPWAPQDFPIIAAWLQQNRAALAGAYEAARLPRYFWPVETDGEDQVLMDARLPITKGALEICYALCARAMLRLHQGNDAGAWDDLLTAMKLARLTSQGTFLWESSNSLAIERAALAGMAQWLEHATVSEEQARQRLNELRSLPPRRSVADIMDHGERSMLLDYVTFYADGVDFTHNFGNGHEMDSLASQFIRAYHIDWDAVLFYTNQMVDQCVAACKASPRFQASWFPQLQGHLENMADGKGVPAGGIFQRPGVQQPILDDRTNKIAGQLIGHLFPDVDFVASAESIQRQRLHLTQLGLALEAYRARHGRYPTSLAELAPDYLAEVPRDIFAEQELIYRPTEDGYLLYSVGPDFDDDGGTPPEDSSDQDYDLILKIGK